MYLTIASVPGAVHSLFETVKSFGSKNFTLGDLLKDSIEYARKGFPVAPFSAHGVRRIFLLAKVTVSNEYRIVSI